MLATTEPIMMPKRNPLTITETLRDAIANSGKSLNSLASEAGTDVGQLSRFMLGQRDLRLATADRLAMALKLVLAAPQPENELGK